MAGVVFIFVREDASEAETLADAFDAAGYSITGKDLGAEALNVVIWSRHALRSHAFHDAAEHALRSGRAIVASLSAPPPREGVFAAAVIDLAAWDGEDDAALDPLFEAAAAIARTEIIELPERPIYEDAEFSEAPLQITSVQSERSKRARQSWEAPIPDQMLRPAPEAPIEKLGAPAPRHDFRRVGTRSHNPAHAALAFVLVALVAGGGFAMTLTPKPAPPARVTQTVAIEPGGVSLESASAEALGLEDVAPIEPTPQAGRRGLEPPSARTIRRAHYAPRDDRAASATFQ